MRIKIKKIIISIFVLELKYTLEELLKDSNSLAEDWARDYNTYDYVIKAKKILKEIE